MVKLKRTISWRMLALYGLGNILGAGIYVLIGEVAEEAGDALVWSFLLAAVVASFTAITYSAMASKYSVSAGAAVYSDRAFNISWLSTLVGLALAFTAVVSSSALLRGFARYAKEFLEVFGVSASLIPNPLITLPLLVVLGYFAFRGIQESTRLAVIFTLLEAGGLLLIVLLAGFNGEISNSIDLSFSSFSSVEPLAIGLGGFLAFYAFVGFEDMVNVAEEVKDPKTSMKKGMLSAVAIATTLYIAVAISALAVLSSSDLASEKAPLAAVFAAATNTTIPVITIIGIIAITNGVLIQIITSSRILYGLAREGWIPKPLAKISPSNKVPTNATIVAISGIAIASSLLPLDTLAQITSFTLLVIFSIVHLAAIKLITSKQLPHLPLVVPVIGIVLNSGIIVMQVLAWTSRLQ